MAVKWSGSLQNKNRAERYFALHETFLCMILFGNLPAQGRFPFCGRPPFMFELILPMVVTVLEIVTLLTRVPAE